MFVEPPYDPGDDYTYTPPVDYSKMPKYGNSIFFDPKIQKIDFVELAKLPVSQGTSEEWAVVKISDHQKALLNTKALATALGVDNSDAVVSLLKEGKATERMKELSKEAIGSLLRSVKDPETVDERTQQFVRGLFCETLTGNSQLIVQQFDGCETPIKLLALKVGDGIRILRTDNCEKIIEGRYSIILKFQDITHKTTVVLKRAFTKTSQNGVTPDASRESIKKEHQALQKSFREIKEGREKPIGLEKYAELVEFPVSAVEAVLSDPKSGNTSSTKSSVSTISAYSTASSVSSLVSQQSMSSTSSKTDSTVQALLKPYYSEEDLFTFLSKGDAAAKSKDTDNIKVKSQPKKRKELDRLEVRLDLIFQLLIRFVLWEKAGKVPHEFKPATVLLTPGKGNFIDVAICDVHNLIGNEDVLTMIKDRKFPNFCMDNRTHLEMLMVDESIRYLRKPDLDLPKQLKEMTRFKTIVQKMQLLELATCFQLILLNELGSPYNQEKIFYNNKERSFADLRDLFVIKADYEKAGCFFLYDFMKKLFVTAEERSSSALDLFQEFHCIVVEQKKFDDLIQKYAEYAKEFVK